MRIFLAVGAVERHPQIGGQRILVRPRSQERRPFVASRERLLHPADLGVVTERPAARTKTRRQGVGDVEERRERGSTRAIGRSQLARALEVALVDHAHFALAQRREDRRPDGAVGRDGRDRRNRAQSVGTRGTPEPDNRGTRPARARQPRPDARRAAPRARRRVSPARSPTIRGSDTPRARPVRASPPGVALCLCASQAEVNSPRPVRHRP